MRFMLLHNFFEDAQAERQKALNAEYSTVEHRSLLYPGISLTHDEDALKKLQDALGCAPCREAKVTYRRYLPSDVQGTYIHNDSLIGDITAVANLSEKPIEFALWRHKETGWEGQPTLNELGSYKDTQELWNRIHEEGLDESKWDMVDRVVLEFNDVVAFLSSKYHSRYPKEPIGSSIEDARLIKIIFYKL